MVCARAEEVELAAVEADLFTSLWSTAAQN